MYVKSRKQINGFMRVNEPAKCCAIAVRSWKVAGSKSANSKQLLNRRALHKPCFYTKSLLHQKVLTLITKLLQENFCARSHLNHELFTPQTFTPEPLHQKPLYTTKSYTTIFLHENFYTRSLLYQKPFAQQSFYTRKFTTKSHCSTKPFLHHKAFSPKAFYTPETFYTRTFNTRSLHQNCYANSRQKPSTPQKPFTPAPEALLPLIDTLFNRHQLQVFCFFATQLAIHVEYFSIST